MQQWILQYFNENDFHRHICLNIYFQVGEGIGDAGASEVRH